MTSKSLVAALAIVIITSSSSFVFAEDCTAPKGKLVKVGEQVTVEIEGNCPKVSVPRLFPNAMDACPHSKVLLKSVEATKATGGAMDKEQKARGDKRWHVVCDWTAAPVQN